VLGVSALLGERALLGEYASLSEYATLSESASLGEYASLSGWLKHEIYLRNQRTCLKQKTNPRKSADSKDKKNPRKRSVRRLHKLPRIVCTPKPIRVNPRNLRTKKSAEKVSPQITQINTDYFPPKPIRVISGQKKTDYFPSTQKLFVKKSQKSKVKMQMENVKFHLSLKHWRTW